MDQRESTNNTVIQVMFPGDDGEPECEHNTFGTFKYPKRYLTADKTRFTRDEVFVKGAGFVIVEEIIKQGREDILNEVRLQTDRGRKLTLDDIFDRISRADKIV